MKTLENQSKNNRNAIENKREENDSHKNIYQTFINDLQNGHNSCSDINEQFAGLLKDNLHTNMEQLKKYKSFTQPV